MGCVKIYVYLNGKIVGKGETMKACLKHITKLFKEGHTNIVVSGGKIGAWR